MKTTSDGGEVESSGGLTATSSPFHEIVSLVEQSSSSPFVSPAAIMQSLMDSSEMRSLSRQIILDSASLRHDDQTLALTAMETLRNYALARFHILRTMHVIQGEVVDTEAFAKVLALFKSQMSS